MKPNRRKAVVSDPIKRIGLNGGNSAREIVIQIARALGFKIHEDNKGVSAYGGNSIRIADHCTYMQTWVDNGTWNAPIRLDVVIEDEPTEAVTQVSIGYDFGITEFVSQSNDIDPQKARIIAYDIRNTMNGNPYANNVRGERHNLVTTHDNNPQQINCNTNMNKKIIRLKESDLHRIVKESVKKILKESVGVFEVYTNDYMQNAPVFVRVGEEFYKVPQEMESMIGELGTRQGRMTFIDAITNGEIPSCNVDVIKLKGHGYKSRAFNANAF